MLRKLLGGIDERALVGSLARNGLAALGMGVVLWLWLHWLASGTGLSLHGSAAAWVATLGGIGLAVVTYGAICLLVKSTELRPALAILLRRR